MLLGDFAAYLSNSVLFWSVTNNRSRHTFAGIRPHFGLFMITIRIVSKIFNADKKLSLTIQSVFEKFKAFRSPKCQNLPNGPRLFEKYFATGCHHSASAGGGCSSGLN